MLLLPKLKWVLNLRATCVWFFVCKEWSSPRSTIMDSQMWLELSAHILSIFIWACSFCLDKALSLFVRRNEKDWSTRAALQPKSTTRIRFKLNWKKKSNGLRLRRVPSELDRSSVWSWGLALSNYLYLWKRLLNGTPNLFSNTSQFAADLESFFIAMNSSFYYNIWIGINSSLPPFTLGANNSNIVIY